TTRRPGSRRRAEARADNRPTAFGKIFGGGPSLAANTGKAISRDRSTGAPRGIARSASSERGTRIRALALKKSRRSQQARLRRPARPPAPRPVGIALRTAAIAAATFRLDERVLCDSPLEQRRLELPVPP